MTEKEMDVTTVQQNLIEWSKKAQCTRDRYILTSHGSAESVLLGIADYRSLKATIALLQRPDLLQKTLEGFQAVQRGEKVTHEQFVAEVERLRTESRGASIGTPKSNVS